MCGIMGYIGSKEVEPILLDGLSKLEYRGYDSAGIAVVKEGKVKIEKKEGKLKILEERLKAKSLKGNVGIGHTRWATHGSPSDKNSHPHSDCSGKIAVVHNGIIENYLYLREWLQSEGHNFTSETDTEVLPHLVEHYYQGNLQEAVQKVLTKVEGSFAFAVCCEDEPDKLVVARQDSPLVLGLGDGENFVASDIPAILNYTRDTYILDDGQMAVVTADGIEVFDFKGNEVDKKIFRVKWDAAAAEKGGYDHFMIKEIHEQPKAIRETLTGRISENKSSVLFDENVALTKERVSRIDKIAIVACGTAYHAGLVGKYVMEKTLHIPVETDIASEFRYRDPLINKRTLMIVISQSGETADTLAALREAKRKGARVLAITNVVGSSVSREADDVIYTWAGPEIAVASTKAYITQLASLYLVAVYLAEKLGTMDAQVRKNFLQELEQLPEKAELVLQDEERIQKLAKEFVAWDDSFFIGRSLDYAVALEGSLKLKEISYIHAEAYAAGELKHGTLALIVPGIPVMALVTQEDIYEKTVSNIKEVKARDAFVTAIAFEGRKEIEKVVDQVIYLPRTTTLLAPILTVIPLQLLAYYGAVERGEDVDKPRNLAKSVTVE
ncbi:glucosamine--fructose-6-phosphate aminotransferase (isomerizing) [Desulfitispora alkaliphila]|uniref:glutamine--fructose-6-phosphate transaminase (isomerizing) n=1 Tax=Desulfitispora alkaliphila TaxID=622674 RepID=UPI003D24216E